MADAADGVTMQFDVVIIGAGVAGLTAGIAAAQSGLSAIVLERCAGPPDRPGETLHPGAGSIFELLGVRDAVGRLSAVRPLGVEVRHRFYHRRVPFGGPAETPWRGYQVCRTGLGCAMLDRVRALGADVRFDVAARSLQVERDGCHIEAGSDSVSGTWVLDATGPAIWANRKLAISTERLSAPMTVSYCYTATGEARPDWPLLTRKPDGWSWEAAVTSDRFAQVVLVHGHRAARAAGWRNADATWRVSEMPTTGRVFQIGDAAGQLDPSAGRGVLRAMMSAMMAVDVIAKVRVGAVASERAVGIYRDWFRAWILSDAAELRELLGHPPRPASDPGRRRERRLELRFTTQAGAGPRTDFAA